MHSHVTLVCTAHTVHRPRSRYSNDMRSICLLCHPYWLWRALCPTKLNCIPWSGVIVYWFSLEPHIENGVCVCVGIIGRVDAVFAPLNLFCPLSPTVRWPFCSRISIVFTIWSRKRSTSLWISTNLWTNRCWAWHHRPLRHHTKSIKKPNIHKINQ